MHKGKPRDELNNMAHKGTRAILPGPLCAFLDTRI